MNKSNGISFSGFLTLMFIGLKLCHQIDWSWWWVLCPLWIGAAIVLFCVVVVFVVWCRALVGIEELVSITKTYK